MARIIFFVGLLGLWAGGYAFLHLNEFGLRGHVGELTQRAGVVLDGRRFEMGNTSRTGWCHFRAGPETIAKLVKGLELEPIPAPRPEEDFDPLARLPAAVDAVKTVGLVPTGRWWRRQTGNPLRVEDGSAFSSVILLYEEGSGRGLLLLAYAYG